MHTKNYMKILYVITKSTEGGAQTHIFQLATYMKNYGYDVSVMAAPGGWLEDTLKENGISFYENKYFSNTLSPLKGWRAVREIKNTVKKVKPDLISCHSTAAGFWTRLAIRNRIPTIFTAHGWGFTDGIPLIKKYTILFLEKIAYRFATKTICVSSYDKDVAARYFKDTSKMAVVHNGVEDIHKEKKKSDHIRIVFVGRLSAQKDPELLVNTFMSLNPKNAELYIIGDGPKKEFLQKDDRIHFLGALSREEVFEELAYEKTLFVLTSFYEGFPRSILEAMVSGAAVVASDVGGVSEVVDGTTGLLVPRGDREHLERVLAFFFTHPEEIEKFGNRARARILEAFTLKHMFEKTMNVYSEVCNDE